MNIRTYWHKKKERLRQLYPFITDKDLDYKVGEENKMIETLVNKIGKTTQEILHMIIML
jgi:hypothetical protein